MDTSIVPAFPLPPEIAPSDVNVRTGDEQPAKSRGLRVDSKTVFPAAGLLDSAKSEAHSLPTPPNFSMESRQTDVSQPNSPLSADEQQRQWFANEVLPHEPALRSWLRARFPSLSDSDDVVQETYARLFRSRSTGKIENAKSYLFSTARNLAVDLFRRRKVAPIVAVNDFERSGVAEERSNVADTVSSAQELEILRNAIDSLPDRCRTIMILQKLQGLSNAEIAAQLNLSINTVNAQLVIGLARCRAYLAARGIFRGNSR
jgi:RNA polymerase sigma-70 factor (ECF subfamily)